MRRGPNGTSQLLRHSLAGLELEEKIAAAMRHGRLGATAAREAPGREVGQVRSAS